MRGFIFSFIAFIIFYSCTRHPYAESNKMYKKQVREYAKLLAAYPLQDSVNNSPHFVGATNFSMRKPNFVVIHHTAQNSCEQTLKTFTTVRTQVSAHYVICKDGTVYHMLSDFLRAWHAGAGKWGNTTDLNSTSIGIELDNNGYEPFAPPQMESLLQLLDRLKRAHNIPTANFIGHGDLAPGRKVDPNWMFPWKDLADRGFGHWYDDTTGVVLPATFNHLQALRIVGYDMKDTTAAMQAFKRHWLQDTLPGLTEGHYKIIYQLSRKF